MSILAAVKCSRINVARLGAGVNGFGIVYNDSGHKEGRRGVGPLRPVGNAEKQKPSILLPDRCRHCRLTAADPPEHSRISYG